MTYEPKLTINGIDVSDLLTGNLKWSQAINEPSKLEAVLRCDGQCLGMVDLHGDVILEVIDGKQVYRQFTGVVVQAETDQTDYQIKCIDPSRILEERTTGGAFGRGFYPAEVVYYLAASLDAFPVDRANFHIGNGRTLADEDWIFKRRRYVFIAPLPFCRLTTDEIECANAWLYRANPEGSADDRIIAKGLPEETPAEWAEGTTRARFYIMAENFLDAFERGRERLRKLVDYLSFGANLTTPCYRLADQFRFLHYDRNRTVTDIRETDWAYVRDTLRADRYWLRWYAPYRLGEPFALQPEDPILDTYPLFQTLLEEEPERLDGRQRSILNALHALRQCRQASNPLDGLVHLWNCVEFMVSGYALPKLFSDDDRKEIIKATKVVLAERYRDQPEEREEREKRIEGLLSSKLNEVPLRKSWQAFCRDHDVNLRKEDDEFLWSNLRRKRNRHQHGHTASAERRDLDRVCSIVEKVLLAALWKFQQTS